MITKPLDELSDEELSEVFATEVVGLNRGPYGFWRYPDGVVFTFKLGGNTVVGEIPSYSTDAGAILPYLYKRYWYVDQTSVAAHPIRVRLDHASGPFGESDAFPRAACLALVRAARDSR